ncbi:cytochrome c oxidase subunit II [Noviherbaspirillum sp. ST9]|uniref:cytochrome c oxidase subunit II n=1 Tax=Noviherbaspirillum sp. ST9 TaxID=3401606 RepID=UPI003B589648
MRRRLPVATLAAFPLGAWANIQSALHPEGKDAIAIAGIGGVMFVAGAAIFVGVMLLVSLAMFGPVSVRTWLRSRRLVVIGGVAFPVIVLTALLIYAMIVSASLVRASEAPDLRIEVVGETWWWRVRYLDASGKPVMETANEIRMPAGRLVELELTTADVIHSFWVPNLAGKTDMIPGHVNRQRLFVSTPGIFRGQCAEYCGAQHANMAFDVAVMPPEDFDAWLAAQQQPARGPDSAQTRRGQKVFLDNDCVKCHTVRGTPAAGTAGPDLTHAGSRLSIAAATLPNGVGAFAGWIAASQHIKPGNGMPSFDRLSPDDLRAIAAYMESLQ